MNQTSPAIVAQSAVRRFPRIVLLVFCLAYVLAGFVGREAWKSADMAALGFMHALANGSSDWWNPTLAGFAPEQPALLPYWLGAWAILARPAGVAFDFAARIPFGMLLGLSMVGTWYGTYYLARSPWAQPVAFAFGGEAQATDYARTVADGGVLAFMACLGLAHLSHETTPALAQLGFTSLLFFAIAALPYRTYQATTALVVGAFGLGLSGAPAVTLLLCSGAALLHLYDREPDQEPRSGKPQHLLALAVFVTGVASAALAQGLHLWKWKIAVGTTWEEWRGLGELLVWFSWPAWPLMLWTLWHWRHRLLATPPNRHLLVPLWFAVVTVTSSLLTGASDRTLLLALPALAALAAFALPTLKRQVASVIDWFTLFFFSGCGIVIWVVWIAMQTGVPAQPAANVARLAPQFTGSFSTLSFAIALGATLVWGWLVHWRVGRHRAALWKSLVLPAGGAGLCWLLLMTLWMPLLDHAQSYTAIVRKVQAATTSDTSRVTCIAAHHMPQGTLAALVSYGQFDIRPLKNADACEWLVTEASHGESAPARVDPRLWEQTQRISNAVGDNEDFWLVRRPMPSTP